MRFIFILLLNLTILVSELAGQQSKSPTEIFRIASETNKPVLLIFSGSDWCIPCIRLQKKIFSDSLFKRFAEEQLILLIADFPQQKVNRQEHTKWNEELAKEFNPEGTFPLLILLRPDRTIVTLLKYENYTSEAFIRQIKQAMQTFKKRNEYSRRSKLMGSAFEFIIQADGKINGDKLLDECVAEVKRIEGKLTEFSEHSETSILNKSAWIQPVKVSQETYSLLERCRDISDLTDGTFDISSGALKKMYSFQRGESRIPDAEEIRTVLKKTGYKKIRLLEDYRVSYAIQGLHIGFGAIGKGYAADQVKKLMIEKGVQSGVINASGDISAWGRRPNGEFWRSGVAHPADPSKIICWLHLDNRAIATSGNYEQYFEINGIRYSHNINPKTGLPVVGVKSVTIISPAAELSDALATAVTVKGVRRGLELINQLPDTHCIIIDHDDTIYQSDKIDFKITS